METLGRREEQILLAVGRLGDEAYLVAIREYLVSRIGKDITVGAVHIPLRRLEKHGYVDSAFGEATSVRGGRRKKIYTLSAKAKAVLQESRDTMDILWSEYSKSIPQ